MGLVSLNFSQVAVSGSWSKLAMPVSPAAALYAHFEHVRGIPDESGLPLTSLRLADRLIDSFTARGLPAPAETSDEAFWPKAQAAQAKAAANPFNLTGDLTGWAFSLQV